METPVQKERGAVKLWEKLSREKVLITKSKNALQDAIFN